MDDIRDLENKFVVSFREEFFRYRRENNFFGKREVENRL